MGDDSGGGLPAGNVGDGAMDGVGMSSTDMSYAFHLLSVRQRDDSRRWFPDLMWRPSSDIILHMMLGLCGEVGELANIVKKANRKSDLPNLIKDPEVAKEIADVFIYLVELASELHINIFDAYESKHIELERRWG